MILLSSDSTKEDRATAVVRAPAKVNLCLDVLGKREDGYHELSTLMVPIGLHDTVSVTLLPPSASPLSSKAEPNTLAPGCPPNSARLALSAQIEDRSGPTIDSFITDCSISLDIRFPLRAPFCSAGQSNGCVPPGVDNLAYRAVARLRDAAGVPYGAHIGLIKRIPTEAGLGGGSSDAAAALIAANAVWGLGWSRSQLANVAADIGSDVPFFLAGRTAVCSGRGERVSPIHHASRLSVVIAQPADRLSTADVFRAYDDDEHPANVADGTAPTQASARQKSARRTNRVFDRPKIGTRVDHIAAALQEGRLAQLGRLLSNQLEQSAGRLVAAIDHLGTAFAKLNVVGHSMTGSGSGSFAICRNARHAQRVAAALRACFPCWVCVTNSCP